MKEGLSHTLSRRDLLKVGAGLATAALFGADKAYTLLEREKSPLSKEQAASLSQKLYLAADTIKPFQPEISTIQQITAFEHEYVPHFATDGLVPDKKLQFPQISSINYLQNEGSVGVFHILGEADCQDPKTPITLNERFFTPYSPWRERKDTGLVIATVAHELAHANQVSCTPFDPNTETATQMVSMNTLAGMAMEGNLVALPGFLNQMGEFSDDFVLSECLKEEVAMINQRTPQPKATPNPYEGDYPEYSNPTKVPVPETSKFTEKKGLGWYQDYLGTLPNGVQHQAAWARSLDYWQHTDWQQLNDIISKYGSAPYKDTVSAMKDKNYQSPPLPIGQDQSPNGQPIPLRMFSTHYVLQNLGAMVETYKSL